MPLVTTKKMLTDAGNSGYAVGAFNVENMEMVQAVVAAAEESRAPVIIQTTSSTLKYASPELFFAMVKAEAEKATVPVAVHLDHGNGFEIAARAFHAGYTSIMIDGSHGTWKENVSVTKRVVDVCHAAGIPVEAELGKVGGKEDDLEANEGDPYTDPEEAAAFVKETGVDFLAVAIGTAHGVYKGTPKLDKERLSQIREKVSVPLVLHGTSGVPDSDVQDCIKLGICKVNYATDLRIAFTNGVKQYIGEDHGVFDPKKYNARGRELVKTYVMQKIEMLGSKGKGSR